MSFTPTHKVWLNVTTSAHWKRPAVGVVRLESMLAAELPKAFPDERFGLCIWQEDRFVACQGQPKGRQLSDAPLPAAPPAELIYPVLPPLEAVVAMVQGCLSLLPRVARPMASRILRRARTWTETALQQARRFRASRQAYVPDEAADDEDCQPGCLNPGDVLISVGLDWDRNFYRAFATLRNKHQVRIVTCCYDVIPLLFPQYVLANAAQRFGGYFIDLAESSEAILCISRRSEQDLLAFLDQTGSRPVRTHVIPLGDNVPGRSGDISAAVIDISLERFILYVSTIERRKNHDILYKAYHLLCRDCNTDQLPQLVLVGMPGWGVADLLKDIELDPIVRGRIRFLHHVTDAELSLLYEKAMFCVYPSLYEGWGLPVGEALAMGKPLLASGCGSLPEVGGDLVRYLDPWNAGEWAAAIREWSTDDALRNRLAESIRRHYVPRSWAATAESVRRLIDDILVDQGGDLQPAVNQRAP